MDCWGTSLGIRERVIFLVELGCFQDGSVGNSMASVLVVTGNDFILILLGGDKIAVLDSACFG